MQVHELPRTNFMNILAFKIKQTEGDFEKLSNLLTKFTSENLVLGLTKLFRYDIV